MEGVPFIKRRYTKGAPKYSSEIWIATFEYTVFIHIILPVTCRFTECSSIQSFLNLVTWISLHHLFSIGFFLNTICAFLFLTKIFDSLLIYPSSGTWQFVITRILTSSFIEIQISVIGPTDGRRYTGWPLDLTAIRLGFPVSTANSPCTQLIRTGHLIIKPG